MSSLGCVLRLIFSRACLCIAYVNNIYCQHVLNRTLSVDNSWNRMSGGKPPVSNTVDQTGDRNPLQINRKLFEGVLLTLIISVSVNC